MVSTLPRWSRADPERFDGRKFGAAPVGRWNCEFLVATEGRRDGRIEILSGLAPGEKVVVPEPNS